MLKTLSQALLFSILPSIYWSNMTNPHVFLNCTHDVSISDLKTIRVVTDKYAIPAIWSIFTLWKKGWGTGHFISCSTMMIKSLFLEWMGGIKCGFKICLQHLKNLVSALDTKSPGAYQQFLTINEKTLVFFTDNI